MKAGMECVLAVLRGSSTTAEYSPQQWSDILTVAEAEKVLPLFLSKLRSSGHTLPWEIESRCISTEREIAVSTFWWKSEMKGILEAFACANLPVILLKGPCLAERFYGDAALRPSRDLDLLVKRSEVLAALRVLTELGFTLGEIDRNQQHCFRATTMVELHFGFPSLSDFGLDSDLMCDRAQPVTFAGQPAFVLSPLDEVFFLCLHAVKHQYEQLSYVLDISLALKNLNQEKFGEAFSKAVRQSRLLALGCAMAYRFDADGLRELACAATRMMRKVSPVADRLWSRFFRSAESPTFEDIWLTFFLLPTRLAKLRFLWAQTGAFKEPDLRFAHRLHLRDPRLVWVLRQLRLSFKVIRVALLQMS